jgi:FkbM family methyltransferase
MKVTSYIINSILQKVGLILTRRINVIPHERLAKCRSILISTFDFNLVIDVGANSGQWAKYLRSQGYRKTLLSIEPTKKAFGRLLNISKNDDLWIPLNVAIDLKESTRKILVSNNDGLSSSFFDLLDEHKYAAPNVQLTESETVKTQTLKSIIAKYFFPNIYIKIDVQGAELLVLQSISDSYYEYILAVEIEVSLVETYESSPLIEEIMQFMRSKSFRPYRIENGLARPNFGQQVQMDIIFLRNNLIEQLNKN